MFVGEKNVGRLHIAMNQALGISRAQTFGRLNPGLQHLFLGQTRMLFDEIVETSSLNQFHYQIKLAMISPG